MSATGLSWHVSSETFLWGNVGVRTPCLIYSILHFRWIDWVFYIHEFFFKRHIQSINLRRFFVFLQILNKNTILNPKYNPKPEHTVSFRVCGEFLLGVLVTARSSQVFSQALVPPDLSPTTNSPTTLNFPLSTYFNTPTASGFLKLCDDTSAMTHEEISYSL